MSAYTFYGVLLIQMFVWIYVYELASAIDRVYQFLLLLLAIIYPYNLFSCILGILLFQLICVHFPPTNYSLYVQIMGIDKWRIIW